MESAQKVWNGNGAHAKDVIHNYFISKLWFSHCKSGDILLFFFCWLLTPTQTHIVVSFILKSCFSNATVQAGQAFANRVVLVADPTPAGEMLSWSVFLWLGGIGHGQLKRIKATMLPTKWVGTTSSGKKKKKKIAGIVADLFCISICIYLSMIKCLPTEQIEQHTIKFLRCFYFEIYQLVHWCILKCLFSFPPSPDAKYHSLFWTPLSSRTE